MCIRDSLGIAVGMASNICSFNLREVCETAIALLKNESFDIMTTLTAPDFSTGGQLVYDAQQIRKIYQTGTGSFKVRAKYRYEKKGNTIEIVEIPYSTTIEAIIDKIVAVSYTHLVSEQYTKEWYQYASSVSSNTAGYSLITVTSDRLTATYYAYDYVQNLQTSSYSWGIIKE